MPMRSKTPGAAIGKPENAQRRHPALRDYDQSAVIRPQNTMGARPSPGKPCDASSVVLTFSRSHVLTFLRLTPSKKFVTAKGRWIRGERVCPLGQGDSTLSNFEETWWMTPFFNSRRL